LIRIATRGSDLALWQARKVQTQLEHLGVVSELVVIKTKGDEIQHLGFDKMEGKGFFTKEIEQALLDQTADLAVHSHKDLETTSPSGLCIAAVSERASAEDLLLIHPNAHAPNEPYQIAPGTVLGTSSARRKSLVRHFMPTVEVRDLRGNVPTRLNKLKEGQYGAIILAKAGVDRLALDLSDLIAVELPVNEFVPAPAQGVLALQTREDDTWLRELLMNIHTTEVARLVALERNVLKMIGGGCQVPLGVHARTNEYGDYNVHVAYSKSEAEMLQLKYYDVDRLGGLAEHIVKDLER
jgi:hydroxymethylbilane synthase